MACYGTVPRRAEKKTFLDPVPTCYQLRRIYEDCGIQRKKVRPRISQREALLNIAATTIDNITKFENHQPLEKLAS